jgi:hypothetical protein
MDAYGAFPSTFLWTPDGDGIFDIIVDTDRDGMYTGVDAKATFAVISCGRTESTQELTVTDGQEHYLTIFPQPEFQPSQVQPVCRTFSLTNGEPISAMLIRRLLVDDEGYVFVNKQLVHYWSPRPRAPLFDDANYNLMPYIVTATGATNNITIYAKDVYQVVQGAIAIVDVGQTAACIQTNESVSVESLCCTGTRTAGPMLTEWVCACKADWTYIEEADEALCCSGRYADRMCVPEGYSSGNHVVGEAVPVEPSGSIPGSQEVAMPGGSASQAEGGG